MRHVQDHLAVLNMGIEKEGRDGSTARDLGLVVHHGLGGSEIFARKWQVAKQRGPPLIYSLSEVEVAGRKRKRKQDNPPALPQVGVDVQKREAECVPRLVKD